MKPPVIHGTIDRRILCNYRVDPEVLARQLPAPFRPKIVQGQAVAGICLIRLKDLRPRGFPTCLGMRSENAAYRAAVEWDDKGSPREGVYVFRRDTSFLLNVLLGGRVFPGVHHLARVVVRESAGEYSIQFDSPAWGRGGSAGNHLLVEGKETQGWPAASVFATVEAASAFFEAGAIGYSPSSRPGTFDGMELTTFAWNVRPLEMTRIESSFYDDESRFPAGSIHFDNALLMTGLAHQWSPQQPICCPAPAAPR